LYVRVHEDGGRGRAAAEPQQVPAPCRAGRAPGVTDRNRPVAELGPPPSTGAALDRLIAEGRVSRPLRRGLPEPLELTGDAYALSRALDEIRGEH
jgi:hypothetical protein